MALCRFVASVLFGRFASVWRVRSMRARRRAHHVVRRARTYVRVYVCGCMRAGAYRCARMRVGVGARTQVGARACAYAPDRAPDPPLGVRRKLHIRRVSKIAPMSASSKIARPIRMRRKCAYMYASKIAPMSVRTKIRPIRVRRKLWLLNFFTLVSKEFEK
jgi:hypothetical protein